MSTRNGRVLTGQRFKIKIYRGYNMDSSIISIIIVLITMGLFVWNRLPISVVAILGSVAMAMFIPEMELSAVYSGFSATGWPMVVGMCVVSAALLKPE